MNEEYVVIWETQEVVKPEFRLYHDERGNVLFYTCEKPEGNYIVIDALTYAEARPDVRVLDGRVIRDSINTMYARLHRSTTGTLCEVEDVSIITENDGQYWSLKTYSM